MVLYKTTFHHNLNLEEVVVAEVVHLILPVEVAAEESKLRFLEEVLVAEAEVL